MSNYERITDEEIYDGFARERHEYRYNLANAFIKSNDIVVDAACGVGYGCRLINHSVYHGFDRIEEEELSENLENFIYHKVDLNTWEPDFEFDVFISIETLEHLEDYKHLIEQGKKAKRLMVISSPVIPTSHDNEFHIQDFTFEQLKEELEDDEWSIIYSEIQDNEYGIFILQKHE